MNKSPASSVVLVLCLLCLVTLAYSQRKRSRCLIGSACNSCTKGNYKILSVRGRNVKVCCSGCGEYLIAGNRKSDGRPYCQCYNLKSISGDCWKGKQCKACIKDSGSINGVPICCAKCEKSGMAISSRSCNCLHNGR